MSQIFETIMKLIIWNNCPAEQNARMALSVAHRGIVIETGEIVIEDTAEKLLSNEEVKKAYLGE